MSHHNKKNHTHKYILERGTWCCVNCPHFLPGNVKRGVLGRESYCWECGEKFIIDSISAMLPKPICLDCDIDNPVRQITRVLTTRE